MQVPTTGANLTTLCATCTPQLVATKTGSTVTITTSAGALLATVTTADVTCSNGVVHIIDSVLVPTNAGIPTADAVQTATAGGYTSLVSALAATGLDVTLSLAGSPNSEWTIFAPANAAFTPVPTYITSNVTTLTKVLTYHVLVGRVYRTDLPLGANLSAVTVNGQSLSILRTATGVTIYTATGGVASVNFADIDSSNAVIHGITAVLVPSGLPAAPQTSGAVAAGGGMTVAAVLAAFAVVLATQQRM